jgi:sulfatase maturation enzyme AslB (radical SAM superfamily)
MNLSLLYRGPLSSCNYGCEYCPFAKHAETDAEHHQDAPALERFLGWVEAQHEKRISVFFTPGARLSFAKGISALWCG